MRCILETLLLTPIMNMYWVYDLPNWLFGLLTIMVTVAIGVGGLYATRRLVRRVHGSEGKLVLDPKRSKLCIRDGW